MEICIKAFKQQFSLFKHRYQMDLNCMTIESNTKISVDALISPGSKETWKISILSDWQH